MFKKEFFVERLNYLMKQNNITKQALADGVNTSRQAVSQFANGDNLPSIDKLIALADHFQVSLDYLVGRSDNPQLFCSINTTDKEVPHTDNADVGRA